MGNTQVFYHRLPALATACCSSMALILLALSGTTCSFLEVVANPGKALATPQGIFISEDIGITCQGELYEIEGDSFWELSRIFLIISLCLGSMSSLIAWLLATFVAPTSSRWKSMSILSALTAVLQVPIFLVFEARPCSSFAGNQSCKISNGVFMLIISTVFWVVVTLLTQILDPPAWSTELDAWRVQKSRQMPIALTDSFDDGEGDEYVLLQRYANQKKRSRVYSLFFGRIEDFLKKHRWANSDNHEVPLIKETNNVDEEEGGGGGWDTSKFTQEGGSYYAKSDNSRLMLKVEPNGKRPGDDQKSVTTFGDLEDMVHLAENGLLLSSPAQSVDLNGEHSSMGDNSKLRGESISSLSSREEKKSKKSTSKKTLLNIAANEKLLSPSKKNKAMPDRSFTNSNEPQIYTDPKAFSASSDNGRALIDNVATSSQTGCLDLGNEVNEDADFNAAPAGKIALGIRALTIRIKRDARRVKGGKGYAMMDDDDDASSLSSDGEYADDEEGETTDIGSPKKAASSSVDGSIKRNLMKNWNSLFQSHSGDSSSEDEDEPENVDYSSDETPLSVSINSLGHGSGRAEGSASSRSDSSDSDSVRRRRSSRRRRRRRAGSLSCGNSVASRTSVMTMTIDEETDYDLKEQESSGDDQTTVVSISPIKTPQSILAESLQTSNPPPLLRTKSAPNLLRESNSDLLQETSKADADDFDTLSFSGVFGKGTMEVVQASAEWIRYPFGDNEATEQDKTQSADWIRPSNSETDSDSEAEEKPADNASNSEQQEASSAAEIEANNAETKEFRATPSTPTTDVSEATQTPLAASLLTPTPDLGSDNAKQPPSAWVNTPATDSESDEDSIDRRSPVTSVTASITTDGGHRTSHRRKKRRSRSLCSPRAITMNCAHRFMEESIYEKGVHSPLIAVVSDDADTDTSRSSDDSDGNNSVKSNKSRRARKARLRRLKRENEDGKRTRSRTLDPPKKRWSGRSRDVIEQAHEIIRMKSAAVVVGAEEGSL
mmetsp:Transcript_23276/g.32609  ORF Transcript_23276/g.32609 Transcript_23276/m.32609 type:complete len:1003 (+) Transcript_23276:322-3330(+)